jgi:hypothetical protein
LTLGSVADDSDAIGFDEEARVGEAGYPDGGAYWAGIG